MMEYVIDISRTVGLWLIAALVLQALISLPLLVINLIRLNRRLNVFVRIEEAAKAAQANPEGYRETLARHEQNLKQAQEW